MRASGEGRFKRGLLVWCCAEFDDVTVMALQHERANGDTRHRMGAVSFEQPARRSRSSPGSTTSSSTTTSGCWTARFRFTDATGKVWEIEAEPKLRLFLHGGGYTSGEDRRGFLPVGPWTERWDLTDRALLPAIDGLNDQISVMRCGDRVGHGIVETLIGEHAVARGTTIVLADQRLGRCHGRCGRRSASPRSGR